MCRGRKTVGCGDVGGVAYNFADTFPGVEEATAAYRCGGTSFRCRPPCPTELLPCPLSSAALDSLQTIFEFRRLEEALDR